MPMLKQPPDVRSGRVGPKNGGCWLGGCAQELPPRGPRLTWAAACWGSCSDARSIKATSAFIEGLPMLPCSAQALQHGAEV
jgi:hypothetical protein